LPARGSSARILYDPNRHDRGIFTWPPRPRGSARCLPLADEVWLAQ
jgi:hypothetical protein